MNDLKTRLTHIVASKPELLKNLNISIPQMWKFVDHLIANGIRVPVLCKDCKHFDEHCSKCYVFSYDNIEIQLEVESDHFCSYGERKDIAKETD